MTRTETILGIGVGNPAINVEVCGMMRDIEVESMCYGCPITVYLNLESQLTRDRFNQISKLPNTNKIITVYALPLTPSPTQYQLNKAGIKENVDYIAYTPSITWLSNDISFDDLKQENTEFKIENKTYILKDKNRVSQMASTYLYWTVGMVEK